MLSNNNALAGLKRSETVHQQSRDRQHATARGISWSSQMWPGTSILFEMVSHGPGRCTACTRGRGWAVQGVVPDAQGS
eukprot:2517570-Rhodomonas_salina.1